MQEDTAFVARIVISLGDQKGGSHDQAEIKGLGQKGDAELPQSDHNHREAFDAARGIGFLRDQLLDQRDLFQREQKRIGAGGAFDREGLPECLKHDLPPAALR